MIKPFSKDPYRLRESDRTTEKAIVEWDKVNNALGRVVCEEQAITPPRSDELAEVVDITAYQKDQPPTVVFDVMKLYPEDFAYTATDQNEFTSVAINQKGI